MGHLKERVDQSVLDRFPFIGIFFFALALQGVMVNAQRKTRGLDWGVCETRLMHGNVSDGGR